MLGHNLEKVLSVCVLIETCHCFCYLMGSLTTAAHSTRVFFLRLHPEAVHALTKAISQGDSTNFNFHDKNEKKNLSPFIGSIRLGKDRKGGEQLELGSYTYALTFQNLTLPLIPPIRSASLFSLLLLQQQEISKWDWDAVAMIASHMITKPSSSEFSPSLLRTPTCTTTSKLPTPTKLTPPVSLSTTARHDKLENEILHYLAVKPYSCPQLCKELGCSRAAALPICKNIASAVLSPTGDDGDPYFELNDEFYQQVRFDSDILKPKMASSAARRCAKAFRKLEIPNTSPLWQALTPYLSIEASATKKRLAEEFPRSEKKSKRNEPAEEPENSNSPVSQNKISKSRELSLVDLQRQFNQLYPEYMRLHQVVSRSKSQMEVFTALGQKLLTVTPDTESETRILLEIKKKASHCDAPQLIASIQKFKQLHDQLTKLRRRILMHETS